jgi:hypothetical protein
MRFEIVAPADVRHGDPVAVRLRLVNVTDRAVTVYLQGRPTAFDVIVTDEAGQEVWRRMAGQTVTAILGIRALAPNESLTFEDVWPQRNSSGGQVPPGRYAISGLMPTDGEPLRTAPVQVHIHPAPPLQ